MSIKRMLSAGLLIAASFGMIPRNAESEMATTVVFACNLDGTYDCGASCHSPPYNGRWCCEM